MGGLKSLVNQVWQSRLSVAVRPAETYLVAVNTLFNIVGGSVWIHGLFAALLDDLDAGGSGALGAFQVNGVPVDDAAPTALAGGALGDLLVCPLDDTGAVPIVLNAAAMGFPNPASVLVGSGKVLGTNVPGTIDFIVTVGPCDGACIFYCVYQAIDPAAVVNVA
jgi:hypothetical protein